MTDDHAVYLFPSQILTLVSVATAVQIKTMSWSVTHIKKRHLEGFSCRRSTEWSSFQNISIFCTINLWLLTQSPMYWSPLGQVISPFDFIRTIWYVGHVDLKRKINEELFKCQSTFSLHLPFHHGPNISPTIKYLKVLDVFSFGVCMLDPIYFVRSISCSKKLHCYKVSWKSWACLKSCPHKVLYKLWQL